MVYESIVINCFEEHCTKQSEPNYAMLAYRMDEKINEMENKGWKLVNSLPLTSSTYSNPYTSGCILTFYKSE